MPIWSGGFFLPRSLVPFGVAFGRIRNRPGVFAGQLTGNLSPVPAPAAFELGRISDRYSAGPSPRGHLLRPWGTHPPETCRGFRFSDGPGIHLGRPCRCRRDYPLLGLGIDGSLGIVYIGCGLFQRGGSHGSVSRMVFVVSVSAMGIVEVVGAVAIIQFQGAPSFHPRPSVSFSSPLTSCRRTGLSGSSPGSSDSGNSCLRGSSAPNGNASSRFIVKSSFTSDILLRSASMSFSLNGYPFSIACLVSSSSGISTSLSMTSVMKGWISDISFGLWASLWHCSLTGSIRSSPISYSAAFFLCGGALRLSECWPVPSLIGLLLKLVRTICVPCFSVSVQAVDLSGLPPNSCASASCGWGASTFASWLDPFAMTAFVRILTSVNMSPLGSVPSLLITSSCRWPISAIVVDFCTTWPWRHWSSLHMLVPISAIGASTVRTAHVVMQCYAPLMLEQSPGSSGCSRKPTGNVPAFRARHLMCSCLNRSALPPLVFFPSVILWIEKF